MVRPIASTIRRRCWMLLKLSTPLHAFAIARHDGACHRELSWALCYSPPVVPRAFHGSSAGGTEQAMRDRYSGYSDHNTAQTLGT